MVEVGRDGGREGGREGRRHSCWVRAYKFRLHVFPSFLPFVSPSPLPSHTHRLATIAPAAPRSPPLLRFSSSSSSSIALAAAKVPVRGKLTGCSLVLR